MDGAAGILVIILSVFLAIFLTLAIVLTILLIKVTRQIKSVTETAQKTAEGIESAVHKFSAVSTPLAFANVIKNIINLNKKKK